MQRPAWELGWERPDEFLATLAELLDSPDINESDKAELAARIVDLRAVAEHKRTLEGLDEAAG